MWLLLLALSGVAEAAPPEPAIVAPPAPAPRVESLRERRWGLFGGGLALFAAGWAIDIGASYGIDHSSAGLSLIPLVGPLVQMGDNWGVVPQMKSGNPQVDQPANQRIDQVNQAIQTGAYVILAVDFALQLAGVSMMVAGAAGRRVTRTYADARGLSIKF